MEYSFLRGITGPGRPIGTETLALMDKIVDMLRDEETLPNAEIARRLDISALKCSQAVNHMIDRGYVVLEYNSAGGRQYSLTDDALARISKEVSPA